MKKIFKIFIISFSTVILAFFPFIENVNASTPVGPQDVLIVQPNGPGVYREIERLAPTHNHFPATIYRTETINNHLYRGTLTLQNISRNPSGTYTAIYSGYLIKTPMLAH